LHEIIAKKMATRGKPEQAVEVASMGNAGNGSTDRFEAICFCLLLIAAFWANQSIRRILPTNHRNPERQGQDDQHL